MIVNWLKHNFKLNKRTISSINADLKEVKDKELLRHFFEICKMRQYPIEEIFKGIIMPSMEKEESKNIGQAISESSGPKKADTEKSLKGETKESCEPIKMQFSGFKGTSANSRTKKRRGKTKKDMEAGCDDIVAEFNDIIVEDDMEEPINGTVLRSWSFADSGEDVTFSASPAS